MLTEQIKRDAESITKAIGAKHKKAGGKTALVMVSGLPCSGKTYFTGLLRERIEAVVIESDFVRKMLFTSPSYSGEENKRLFDAIHHVVDGLLKAGSTVILDATSLKERDRSPLYEIADKNASKLIIAVLEAPADIIKKRLKGRAACPDGYSDADAEVYKRMKETKEKVQREHILVNTSGDVGPFLDKIEKILKT